MEPTSWRRLRLEPGGGQVVLHVDATIALGCLDRLTGSDGAAGTPPRPLTAIETAVLAPLLDGMTGDLERAWARAGPVRLSSRSISSDLQLAGLAQRQEAVVEVSLQVRARPFSGLVMICYPLTALRPLFDVLTARNPPEAEGRVLAGHSPLPVSAQVGAARLSASQARALAVGDVVLLDARAGDPVTVCVDGEPRLTGLPYVPESGQTIVKLWQQLPQAGGRP
jgi:flagellar motor switch protein FliM